MHCPLELHAPLGHSQPCEQSWTPAAPLMVPQALLPAWGAWHAPIVQLP